jgi:hypothetical protein
MASNAFFLGTALLLAFGVLQLHVKCNHPLKCLLRGFGVTSERQSVIFSHICTLKKNCIKIMVNCFYHHQRPDHRERITKKLCHGNQVIILIQVRSYARCKKAGTSFAVSLHEP